MFTNPLKNLKTLRLRENDIVVDLGAGTGYYSIPAGHMVTKGKVYAVELQKDFLATIKNKITEAHLKNVEIILGDVEKFGGTKIGNNAADVIIASNILFQIEDKNNFIKEIKRILKPKGRVLLVDWSSESPAVYKKSIVLRERALMMFKEHGFILDRDIDAGVHHYGMILVKL